MFGNHAIADWIAIHCAGIDMYCRHELHLGRIVAERDYVSALSTRIRDNLTTAFGISCYSQTLDYPTETTYGADGIIVFKYDNEIKAGIFEAKRPQIYDVANPGILNMYRWDYLTGGISHFSDQINRQHPLNGTIALWEMFFNNGPDGFRSPPFEYFGSSCAWHNNAYSFMHSQRLIYTPWDSTQLELFLKQNGISFYSVIYDILTCKAGKKHKVDAKQNTARIVSPENDNIVLNIPIPLDGVSENDSRVTEFLTTSKLDNFTFINLDGIEKVFPKES